MKKAEIKVGGVYIAKVSNKLAKVKVETIRTVHNLSTKKDETRYDILNLDMGRRTVFRSAAKFRGYAMSPKQMDHKEVGPQ
jgi:hypothetical protein